MNPKVKCLASTSSQPFCSSTHISSHRMRAKMSYESKAGFESHANQCVLMENTSVTAQRQRLHPTPDYSPHTRFLCPEEAWGEGRDVLVPSILPAVYMHYGAYMAPLSEGRVSIANKDFLPHNKNRIFAANYVLNHYYKTGRILITTKD